VGLGLKDSLASGKIKRGELFVTTKLWCTYHTRVEENLDLSLQRLGLDYVDLYLMHWPIAMNPNGQSSFLLIMPRYIALSVRRAPKLIRYLIQERALDFPVIVFHEPLTLPMQATTRTFPHYQTDLEISLENAHILTLTRTWRNC
jgi:hypothetical protein